MKLYFKYMGILLKSQMEYRVSLLMVLIGQFLISFTVFAGLYFLFERFGNISGWNLYEVALCFSIINVAFSFSECFIRGFDSFSKIIRLGEFDRLLLRPRSTVIQVMGSMLELSRIGRLLQGISIFVIAILNLNIHWTILKILLLILVFVSGVFVFSGIFIITATICFWTIQGIEVANILTHGGREFAQYPLSIYKKWFARFFTFIIPFGCVNYLPLMYILDKEQGSSIISLISPLYGITFIIPALFIWSIGVKHYKSTGS